MAATRNNQFWKARSSHGRNKIFSSPQVLWEAATEYFQWCDENPWIKNDVAKAGDHFGEKVEVEVQRPYTIDGFCLFLDIDENTFQRYRKDTPYKDFWAVANKIAKAIRTQKFEGATVGVFNANIIARDLGLADQQRINHEFERPILEGGKELPGDDQVNRESILD